MVSFKQAELADIPLIRHLADVSWRAGYTEILSQQQIDYMLLEMYSAEEITAQIKNPNYHYFLIFKEDGYLGFIGFEHHFSLKTTKLHRLYLIPEAKGKGAGKQALSFLKSKTAESGDLKIILNVNKNNPAKGFYGSQGFSVYEEAVVDIGNGFVMDDYLMEFHL